jgi:hypothetical protein
MLRACNGPTAPLRETRGAKWTLGAQLLSSFAAAQLRNHRRAAGHTLADYVAGCPSTAVALPCRRFTYCALLCLSILGRLDAIAVPKALAFVARCKNFDGGFGCTPGAQRRPALLRLHCTAGCLSQLLCNGLVSATTGNESHAGQVFTCIGALALADALHLVDRDLFCWW